VEGTHGELCAWFADRLRGHHADCFSKVDHFTGGEIDAVAFLANSPCNLAGNRRAKSRCCNTRVVFDFLCVIAIEERVALVLPCLNGEDAAGDTIGKRAADVFLARAMDDVAFLGATIGFENDDIVRDVEESLKQAQATVRRAGGDGTTLSDTTPPSANTVHTATMAVEVPAAQLDDTLDHLGLLGAVQTRAIDAQDVAATMARYDLLACPVLDTEGRLLGIVTVDDAIDAIIPDGLAKKLPRFTARHHNPQGKK